MDTQKVVRSALILWIGYFFVLALVDWFFVSSEFEVILYYAIQGLNGAVLLGFTLLPWAPLRAERHMLPVALLLMTLLPTSTVHIMLRVAPNESLLSAEGMSLRLTPILLTGLLLTAWKYEWRHVILFCLGTAALNLIAIWGPLLIKPFFPPPPLASRPPPPVMLSEAFVVTFIQTISFLVVGYFTSALNGRIRAQQLSLEEANAQLRDQASTQVELTISQERNRMARELHDTLAHTLSGLTVQLQTVKAYWDIEPATSQQLLDTALSATRSGLQETRRALKSLRATPLEDLGLALALRELAKAATERANLKLRLSLTEPLPPFTPEVTHCIYRIAQEAIMNVVYHADAKSLFINLAVNSDKNDTGDEPYIGLTVQDDGIGFDSNQEHPNHWGLAGMRERAQLLGGHLLIESQVAGGTTVRLLIPKRAR